MKKLFTIGLFLGGLWGLPASAELNDWIMTCGNPDNNRIGTSKCPATELGEMMQATTADELSELAGVVNIAALVQAVSVAGGAVIGRAASGGCRDSDFVPLVQPYEIWNDQVVLSGSASGSQTRLFDGLGLLVDNAAEYSLEGC